MQAPSRSTWSTIRLSALRRLCKSTRCNTAPSHSQGELWLSRCLAYELLLLRRTDLGAQVLQVNATITALPGKGKLFQTADGVTPGLQITAVPAAVTSAQNRVLYVSSAPPPSSK